MSIQDELRQITLGDAVGDLPGLALEACDRLDALEAALREISECPNASPAAKEPFCDECLRVARAALESSS